MNTVMVQLDKLKFADYNPRTISTQDFEALQRSIDEFGFVEPLVVNEKSMVIVGGHQRARAAGSLGMTEVPVVFVDLSPERERALNVALNKIGGEFDNEQLQELLMSLPDDVRDLTGFDDEAILELQDGFVEHDEDGPKVKEPAEPKYTTKDLWNHWHNHKANGGVDSVAEFIRALEGRHAASNV